ncbi:MAG: YdeI/OmpD-associated family protein [Algoriphagus aquaeductus]|uniref:YdeI/OmpD-associated family protein n=1 Tax=Algoriphagus aquaeductus TaxID=475299 RepID=UPI00391B73A8
MIQTDHFQQVEVTSQAELRNWLEQHHQQEESVWLVTYLKSIPEKYLSREEVLDELICFGWIDGIRRKLDERRTMQLISPRRVQHWAKSYKDRAAKLIAEGKMHAAGFRSIEHSKQAGLWDFMEDVDRLEVPQDLQDGLDKVPRASDFFHRINDSSKRFVLRWLKLAKTEKTRKARIQQLVELSGKGEKLKGS